MAGYAEAGAELPSPWNMPFKVWLKLPELPRRAVVLLVFYPIIAFLSVVTIFQLLPRWINIEPIQRYALRGLGIDKQNLIDTSGVIDTVSIVKFDSDLSGDLQSVYIRRGQNVEFVAKGLTDPVLRDFKLCSQPTAVRRPESVELGTLTVGVPRFNYTKLIPFLYSSQMQSTTLISSEDWLDAKELKKFDSNDDVLMNISYARGPVYSIGRASVPSDLAEDTPAARNLTLACDKFTVTANIRIAKPELLHSR